MSGALSDMKSDIDLHKKALADMKGFLLFYPKYEVR